MLSRIAVRQTIDADLNARPAFKIPEGIDLVSADLVIRMRMSRV